LDAATASAEKRAKFEKRPSNNPEGVNGGGRKKGSLRTRAYLKQAAERNVRKKKKNRRKTNERKKEKRREKVDAELQLNWAASKAYMEAQLPVLRAAHQFDIRAVWRSKSDRDDPSDDLRSVLSERQITKLRRQCLGILNARSWGIKSSSTGSYIVWLCFGGWRHTHSSLCFVRFCVVLYGCFSPPSCS
jgi:hypothetical protein